jgi:membrane peptidoglycan carboxypeptidase
MAMQFAPGPGPSHAIRFPTTGPYDQRLGYGSLAEAAGQLAARGMAIDRQARWSASLLRGFDQGLFPPYSEVDQAGLRVVDCRAETLFERSFPERVYGGFEAIPPLLWRALLEIEDQDLLAEPAWRNPAVSWSRMLIAAKDALLSRVGSKRNVPGASTLATQIEKFRHASEGRTRSAADKVRQMWSASLRAYRDGSDTLPKRREVIVRYLNGLPLGGVPGHGEVIGIGDGLWAWFGTDFGRFNERLDPDAPLADRASALKQGLALLIAQRRPNRLLVADRALLERRVAAYARLMARNGIITADLAQAVARAALPRRTVAAPRPTGRYVERKAADSVRVALLERLKLKSLYQLDRTHLIAQATIDRGLQRPITNALLALGRPGEAKKAGLGGARLLGRRSPEGLQLSFTLYEQSHGLNLLRVQTDNYEGPFSLNEGMKLELGSTAKLRVLVSHLQAVAEIDRDLGQRRKAPRGVGQVPSRRYFPDPLAAWVAAWRRRYPRATAAELLEAALRRRISASPSELFFTGGGLHRFNNFDRKQGYGRPTVREAFRQSINLPFIRLLREVIQHLIASRPESAGMLTGSDPAARTSYLRRFVELEGREFTERFYRKHRDGSPCSADPAQARRNDRCARLLRSPSRPPRIRRLAAVYTSLFAPADAEQFLSFVRTHRPGLKVSRRQVERLLRRYPVDLNWQDRGYLARVHPIELWVVDYLRRFPRAILRELQRDGADVREQSYRWLFVPRRKAAQYRRLRILLEVDAFEALHRQWAELGYPFPALVPSLATAIGNSGDRPTALAELVGILLAQGVRYPSERITRLEFAKGTPYETDFVRRAEDGRRVLSRAVARAVVRELQGVVDHGTGRRVRGVFRSADGRILPVGGKTGTGDNRFKVFGSRTHLTSSRVISRTATFVFFIGDRWFGAITVYAPTEIASQHRFTSAIATQVLRRLVPQLAMDSVSRCELSERVVARHQ